MFVLDCPFCGESREEQEFSYAGEALIERPPLDCDDQRYGDYLFNRTNAKGVVIEQWAHTHGCRKIFLVERCNVTNAIQAIKTFAEVQKAK